MRRDAAILLPVLALVALHGCREPFMPQIEGYEDILVVDGLVTDQPGPHTVRLSRSFPFDRRFPEPEEGATVLVRDGDSGSFLFTEQSPGIYLSDDSFRGVAGRKYQLFVSTTGGTEYESEWVLLRGVPGIDSVTWKFLEIPGPLPGQDRYGVQVSVNTHDPSDETRYYRWEWSETWEIITPVKSSLYLDEERCWKSVSSSQVSISTTEHLVSDVVKDQPLFIIPTDDSRLRVRYSVLVRQYSMSRETYTYWKNLQDITRNTGSLFDPVPSQVTGNMYDRDHPGNPVLGVFQASAVSMQRIFIHRSGLPGYLNIPSGFEGCRFFATANPDEILYYQRHGWELVDQYVEGGTLYSLFTNSPACFRCSLSGSNVRPGYWPVD